MQHPSYLLWCTPPSSPFIKSLIYFNFSLCKMFGCLLGPRSFDSPKWPLVHKQTSFPITFGGIELISTTTIAPATYLRSWGLVTLVIVARFMVETFLLFWSPSTSQQQHISFPITPQGDMWSSTIPRSCMSSSIWTIHWATNGSTSRFHLRAFAPSYRF